ncbi:MAG TPA: ABC transporter ATP-binding protein, partial [Bacillota bacterium]|nr:ABC transporter ATP-binding protein [Bacillota bacterium]
VTKYYNRHKKNQIAVCDDISLTIDKTGLVVIIGASGSGKTTLLNVISGMDKFDTGRLIFDDVVIDKYKHKKWDSIRKKNIGYVYQNYHLLKSITVYQNIEFVLRMQGFKNDEIIRNHVDRLLKAVGLENYSDRYVKQLSGGEQQRVAFARALANDPEVILADEPTGNLDGRTTIEIMNVIKKISKTRLVIMVTHEKTLSDYFADRVIKIDKGKVIEDYVNDPEHRLELPQEHIITLSEFKRSNIDTDHLNINRYTNNKTPDKLNIDLIERNQTLYVKIDSSTLKRTKYIDSDSEIMIQDQPKDDYVEENPFMLEDIYPENGSDNNRKVFRVKDIFRYALRKLNFSKGGTL